MNTLHLIEGLTARTNKAARAPGLDLLDRCPAVWTGLTLFVSDKDILPDETAALAVNADLVERASLLETRC
jgi:hypothetical protein